MKMILMACVNRWTLSDDNFASRMRISASGEWVRYEDYTELADEVARLRGRLEAIAALCDP